jgi:hypothetical protein
VSGARAAAVEALDRALARLPDDRLWLAAAADRAGHPAYRRRVAAWRRRLEQTERWSAEQLAA